MGEKGNNLRAGGGAGVDGSAPLFTEEAEETARPVVPLRRFSAAWDAAKRNRPALGGRPRNLLLALALVAAGTVGAAAGYLAGVGKAPAPAAEATAQATPEPAPPQPAPPQPVPPRPVPSASSDAAAAAGAPRMRVEVPARFEPERTTAADAVRAERDEEAEERAERAREEEERRREAEEERAEEAREEAEERAERRRDAEKRQKKKARLIGVVTERPRP